MIAGRPLNAGQSPLDRGAGALLQRTGSLDGSARTPTVIAQLLADETGVLASESAVAEPFGPAQQLP